jgi:methanogenic corrinoid protein MtbC1
MPSEVLLERFFTALISGDRPSARQIVSQVVENGYNSQQVFNELYWPTLVQIQRLYRADQMSEICHHYATRVLRTLVDQSQLRLESSERRGKRILVVSGPEESEEIGAQMVSDLLEAAGYEVRYAGGGVANDEIVCQIGELSTDVLVVFGAVPSTVPFTRMLVDRLHAIGVCPKVQIVVGGGIFNRAEGLAEEIGADLWGFTPAEVVEAVSGQPTRRMKPEQRTVGRKGRSKRDAA